MLREQASIAVEVLPPSLSEQAQNVIQQSQEYLTIGQYRQAEQEILWLLETASTLFQGLTIGTDTAEGKYFNAIATSVVRTKKQQRWSVHSQSVMPSQPAACQRSVPSCMSQVAAAINLSETFHCMIGRSFSIPFFNLPDGSKIIEIAMYIGLFLVRLGAAKIRSPEII